MHPVNCIVCSLLTVLVGRAAQATTIQHQDRDGMGVNDIQNMAAHPEKQEWM